MNREALILKLYEIGAIKFGEKCPFSHHNNTALTKQISLLKIP